MTHMSPEHGYILSPSLYPLFTPSSGPRGPRSCGLQSALHALDKNETTSIEATRSLFTRLLLHSPASRFDNSTGKKGPGNFRWYAGFRCPRFFASVRRPSAAAAGQPFGSGFAVLNAAICELFPYAPPVHIQLPNDSIDQVAVTCALSEIA